MNVVANRMTLGQADDGALSSDVTSSPAFVAGATLLGVVVLNKIWGAGASVNRSLKRRTRRKKRISELEAELKREKSR